MMSTQQNLIKAMILAVFIFPAVSAQKDPEPFFYDSLDGKPAFVFLGDASIDDGVFHITPNPEHDNSNLFNSSGRVMLAKSHELWSEEFASSFHSRFFVNMSSPFSRQPGGGRLAFIIAPDLTIPSGDDTIDRNASNKLVAIEIDTVKQEFDPNSHHIGININGGGVKWNSTSANLSSIFYVWVEYKGKSKSMEVYVNEKNKKPNEPLVLSLNISLTDYVNRKSYFGFSASTGSTAQLNSVLAWDLTVTPEYRGQKKELMGVWFGLGIIAVVISEISLSYYFYKKNPSIV